GAAQAALTLTQAEVELAKTQRVLRVLALEREQNLRDRGIGTDATVETVTLTLSSADQTLLSRQSAVAQVETRISQAEISIQRNQISVEEARRILAETQIIAPFDGVLSDVSAMLGRLVSPNEQMAILIDPAALEVAFRVTNSQFARLVDSDGNLRPALVQVIFDRNDFPFEITTTLARTGAEVGDGQTGRLIYARLTGTAATVLLPGDFLTVLIEEPPIENVSIIPAAAVSSDGGLLIVGDDDRLSEITVTILRQQGDQVIVTGAPVGQEYVTAWSTQIGEGIQIRPLREDDAPTPASSPSTETMTLTDERRDQLIEFVNGNTRMPDQAKARILAQLSEPEVPVEVVTQLEDRMGG
ncbi:MAG: HlyD family efflux transporter periplasmic adaptor subunit, partial [Rhodobacteraceae bacterium]|nr:HlyD family efflux transporter periplasmic adaptor subunit [Paracoccaceae bacterium]